MLCKDVKRVVYFFLDGSMSDSKKQALEIHLSNCPDCEIRIVFSRKLRSFFKKRTTHLAAPETLRVRLSQTLRTIPASE
jgi:mycothiol system anti-sigma-R factor